MQERANYSRVGCDTFNYETFMDAVTQFRKDSDVSQKICVVLDNAIWHKKGGTPYERKQKNLTFVNFFILSPS